MPDATPAPVLPPTADQTPYVPVSWTAVAAALAAGVFVVLILFLGYSAAFKDKKPLIMPTLLALPAVGVVLSFAARRVIRNSEGTRTGENLANAAWWVSVIGGAGYAAYLFAIEYSIRRDAEAEVRRWMDSVLAGDVDAAFYRTREPGRRAGISPADPAGLRAQFPEDYIAFGQTDVVRLAKRNPGACSFEPGVLTEWVYRPGQIDCVLTGVLKTPEGIFPLQIPLKGFEQLAGSEAAPGRQWAIGWTPGGLVLRDKTTLTPYGWRVVDLEMSGSQFGREFVNRASSGPDARAFLYQAMVSEDVLAGRRGDRNSWEAVRLSTPARWAAAGGTAGLVALTADYAPYIQDKFYTLDGGQVPGAEKKAKFLAAWTAVGLFPPGRRLPGNDKIDANDFLTVTDTAIEIRVPCEIPAVGTPELAASRGRVVVTCTEPDVLADLKRLRAEANADRATPTPPDDFRKRQYNWRVVRVESDMHEVSATPRGPGGRPMPGGPPGAGGMPGPGGG